MFRYILYALIIYLVYLAIKWAFRLGQRSGEIKGESKFFNKPKKDPKDIEDADFTEVKKDNKD